MPASLLRAFDEGVEISRFKRRLDGPHITELSPGIATNGGRGIGTASSGSGPTFMFGQGVQGERAFLNNCRGKHLGAPLLGGSFVKTPRIWVRPAQQRVSCACLREFAKCMEPIGMEHGKWCPSVFCTDEVTRGCACCSSTFAPPHCIWTLHDADQFDRIGSQRDGRIQSYDLNKTPDLERHTLWVTCGGSQAANPATDITEGSL